MTHEVDHEFRNSFLKSGEKIDDLQRGGLTIIQDPGRFCFGMDGVLLAAFAKAPKGGEALDLGTGTGVIPLLMSERTSCRHLTGLEIQKESADMAARSVAMNRLDGKISIVEGDIREADCLFTAASFDVVTSNPPYMINQHGLRNRESSMLIARHEVLCTFEDLVRVTERLLKPGGHFYLVHRPFRLAEIMIRLCEHHLEPKRMRLVYPFIDREPNMVLIDCVRGGRPRLTVEKPLIVYEQVGRYTQEVRDIYES